MNKGKYIISCLLACFILVTLISGIPGKQASAEVGKISDIVEIAGITRDKDGSSIIKKKYVTREEFAQILVQASPYNEEVKKTNKLKLFKDVKQQSSKAAYIQIAVSKGYMSTYLGGMFKPEKQLTLKEAIYGSLELLGYTKSDFSGNLSNARLEKFKELGLSKDLAGIGTDKLTKKDCETLFYNILNAKQKTGDIYAKALGFSLNEENKVDYASILDKKTEGPYLTKKGWEKTLSRKLSSYNILLNNKKITANEIEDGSIAYYSENANKVWIYKEKVFGTLENITYSQSEPLDFMISGTNYTVEKPAKMKQIVKEADIKKGRLVILLLGRDGKASYVLPIKSMIAQGNWEQQLSFKANKATVYKNDKVVTASEIKNNDVIYFSKELLTIWVYDKKVFGSLDSIISSQGEPQQLIIAGVTYPVVNSKEIKDEVKKSSIKSGMPVVVLFGWEDKIANVLPLTSSIAGGDWQQLLPFDLSVGTIFKNGVRVSSKDIESTDVIYCSKELQTIWAYGKRVYGVLDSINPSVSSPESIVVAGKTYDLKLLPITSKTNTISFDDPAENEWGKRIRENGVRVGDNVVLYLGYNGKAAEIKVVQDMPITIAGYVLEVENDLVKEENKENIIKRIIRLVDTEGAVREFPCADGLIVKGSSVEVKFEKSKPVITKIDPTTYKNEFASISTKKIAEGARIIEVNDTNFRTITATELKESIWYADNTLYCRWNAAGEITDLIIRNTADSFYQYGLVKKVNISEELGYFTFTFDLAGSETTLVTNNPKGYANLGPVAVRIENGEIKDMKSLKDVPIAYISGKQANTGEEIYRIADNAVVYFYKEGEYFKGKLEDLDNLKDCTVKGYVEHMQGPIWVIVVSY